MPERSLRGLPRQHFLIDPQELLGFTRGNANLGIAFARGLIAWTVDGGAARHTTAARLTSSAGIAVVVRLEGTVVTARLLIFIAHRLVVRASIRCACVWLFWNRTEMLSWHEALRRWKRNTLLTTMTTGRPAADVTIIIRGIGADVVANLAGGRWRWSAYIAGGLIDWTIYGAVSWQIATAWPTFAPASVVRTVGAVVPTSLVVWMVVTHRHVVRALVSCIGVLERNEGVNVSVWIEQPSINGDVVRTHASCNKRGGH